jgi:hypothetical protein
MSSGDAVLRFPFVAVGAGEVLRDVVEDDEVVVSDGVGKIELDDREEESDEGGIVLKLYPSMDGDNCLIGESALGVKEAGTGGLVPW